MTDKEIEERARKIYYDSSNKETWTEEHYDGLLKIAEEQKKKDIKKAQRAVCEYFCNCKGRCKEPNPNCGNISFITNALKEE